MCSQRLQQRVTSANSLGVGTLRLHKLTFHKVSKKDGSGKCDIFASDTHEVIGVLFRIDPAEKPKLVKFEGLGKGYNEKEVEIITKNGQAITAFTYYATDIDPTLNPFTWYLRHVIEGAKDCNLPESYIKMLETVEAVRDPDFERERKELEIYHK